MNIIFTTAVLFPRRRAAPVPNIGPESGRSDRLSGLPESCEATGEGVPPN
jgi:hypothetical protein